MLHYWPHQVGLQRFDSSDFRPRWHQAGAGPALLQGHLLLPPGPGGRAGLWRGRRHHPQQTSGRQLVRGGAARPLGALPHQLRGCAGASAVTVTAHFYTHLSPPGRRRCNLHAVSSTICNSWAPASFAHFSRSWSAADVSQVAGREGHIFPSLLKVQPPGWDSL